MRWQDLIGSDPEIMHGATCFRGTRIPVSVVLDNLAGGEPAAEIHAQYPSLPKDAIPAAFHREKAFSRRRLWGSTSAETSDQKSCRDVQAIHIASLPRA